MGIRQGGERDLGYFFSFSFKGCKYPWSLGVGTQFESRTRLLIQAVQPKHTTSSASGNLPPAALPKSLEVPHDTAAHSRQVRDHLHPDSSDLDGPSRQKKDLGDLSDEPQITQQGCGRYRKHGLISL